MHTFGSCCKELADAIHEPPNSVFRVESNGVFYMSVGFTVTEAGTGWFDQAVLFCPFCGTRLQTSEQIQQRAGT